MTILLSLRSFHNGTNLSGGKQYAFLCSALLISLKSIVFAVCENEHMIIPWGVLSHHSREIGCKSRIRRSRNG